MFAGRFLITVLPATPLFSPACWEPGFQAWAQSTCPELSAQGLVPLRWGCALPSPNAPGRAPNHFHTTLRWGSSHGAGDSASSLLRGQRALTHAVHSWELPTCQDLAEPFKCTISFNPRNTRRSRCCCYAGSSLQVRIPTCRASETHPSTKLGMGSQPWARTQAGLDTPS